jgi:hypothetical protein
LGLIKPQPYAWPTNKKKKKKGKEKKKRKNQGKKEKRKKESLNHAVKNNMHAQNMHMHMYGPRQSAERNKNHGGYCKYI